MLNHHRKDRRRLWAGSAITTALVAASMAFGTAGHAQEKGGQKQERRERVIIMEHKDGEARGDRVIRRRDGEPSVRIENCRSEGGEAVNIDEGSGDRRVRLMLCTKGEGADRATALQRARERIAESDDLTAEIKQRVLAQIDQAIARARGR